ncbi:monooxygenase FAD-binding protein [Mycobacteroides abscessus subsp. bolletii]|uniref:FAD-dependent monooxygenase n=1 Tax=Mycobacteroides abscessus TaxID=36809 RepID=UPI0009A6E5C2|nr:FAD-dependent monooxygenase [Mycobacteroides abscessus]SKG69961.1 monooxygenase FAD-binding protein [Mycobacteroides abscessus subsp. bolletii]SLF40627.1 monooxygenase FAD-binding protein [Mycobacteroides abscessus subsp. bolletii]
MRVLISGASIAGPVLAYWLARQGLHVTVVERVPALRKSGGHAVDLFRPAMEIAERMGVLAAITERATGIEQLVVHPSGARRPVKIDYRKLLAAASDRHVEIMRDDLSEIFYEASRDDVEYIFGDEITALSQDGEVNFHSGASGRYDVIVGADGLHSGVRRLVFGDAEASSTDFLGAYLSVVSVPREFAYPGPAAGFLDVGRGAMMYTADHLDDARAVFMFRPVGEAEAYDYRDIEKQKTMLRSRFTGLHRDVDQWLGQLNDTPAFYFDTISQLRLTSWSRERVTLVGDAGYCPGPAVGGSTSLAVLGAYVLAGELGRAGGDFAGAFRAYENVMAGRVLGSRRLARTAAKTMLPSSGLALWALVAAGRVISVLPSAITSSVARLSDQNIRFYDSMTVPQFAMSTD